MFYTYVPYLLEISPVAAKNSTFKLNLVAVKFRGDMVFSSHVMFHIVIRIQDFLKKIEEKFGKDGAKLHNMQLKDFTNFYSSLFEQMKMGLNKTTGAALMKDYSPWLQNFQANQYSKTIEIPGTYVAATTIH